MLGEREGSLQVELGVESRGRGGEKGSGKGAGVVEWDFQKPPEPEPLRCRKAALKPVTKAAISGGLVDRVLYALYVCIS